MSDQQPISTFLGIAAGLVVAANSHAIDIFVNCTCGRAFLCGCDQGPSNSAGKQGRFPMDERFGVD